MTPAQLTGAFQAIAHLADYSGGAFNPDIKRICETAMQKAAQIPKNTQTDMPVNCPFCGESYLNRGVCVWSAHSQEEKENTANLEEHQCRECSGVFWTGAND